MNKKGFTVIELLAVILVMAILLIIAVPTILKYMKQGTKSYYTSLESEVKVAGADYVETYRSLLPQNIGHVRVIALEELVENKYIDPVKDEKGNACTGQVTVKKVKTDSYEYYSCLKCGTYYSSKEENCSYSEYDNEYVDSGDYRIEVPQDLYIVNQTEKFTSPLAKVYYKEEPEPIKSDLKGNPEVVDTNKLGEYEVIYYYHGAKKIVTVRVIDNIKPGKTKIVMRYTDKNGKSYQGNWFSGDIYVSYKATDYTSEGIKGSGIDHYEVSTDGVNFVALDSEDQTNYEKISETEQLMIKEGNYVRYVRAVDKEGNVGPTTTYRTKIDKTKPTCTWAGESTDWQPNLYLPVEQRIQSRTIVATCHDSVSDCTTATASKTWIETETNKTKYLAYTMIDLAGNTQVCDKTVNIYLDKQKPTISSVTLAMGSEDYTFATNAKKNLTTTCGPSGCTIACDPATSRKTGVYTVTCTITSTVGLNATTQFSAKHQYTVSSNTITDATYCGTHTECSTCHSCCATGEGPRQGCDCLYEYNGECLAVGGCYWYTPCRSCDVSCNCHQVTNTCSVYTCTDEARHADGSAISRTDNVCYY